METDKIRAAILDKAQKEAEEITVSARLKAEELITNANEQKKNGSRRRKNGLYQRPNARHRGYWHNPPSRHGRKY